MINNLSHSITYFIIITSIIFLACTDETKINERIKNNKNITVSKLDDGTIEYYIWNDSTTATFISLKNEDTLKVGCLYIVPEMECFDFTKNDEGIRSKLYVRRNNIFSFNEKICLSQDGKLDSLNSQFLDFHEDQDNMYIKFVGTKFNNRSEIVLGSIMSNFDEVVLDSNNKQIYTFFSKNMEVKIPKSDTLNNIDKGVFVAIKDSLGIYKGKSASLRIESKLYFSIKNLKKRNIINSLMWRPTGSNSEDM